MFLYMLVEDIKNKLRLVNNTHIFDPYIHNECFLLNHYN